MLPYPIIYAQAYLIPRQARGPLLNETRYCSSFPGFSVPNHLSGMNSCGLGNIVGLKCTNVEPIATTVCR